MGYEEGTATIRRRGSFTVEAALIMPVILGVIVLFIRIAMVFYDRCVMEYVCQTVCQRAVYENEDEAGIEERTDRYLSERLLLDWDTQIDVKQEEDRIIVRIGALGPLFSEAGLHTAEAYKHFCPKY